MNLDDDTRRLLAGDDLAPSWLLALLPATAAPPSVTAVLHRLESGTFEVLDHTMLAEPEMDQAHWEMRLDLQAADGERIDRVGVWAEPNEALDEAHLDWQGMTADDIALAQASRWCLGVSVLLGARPLEAYHRQLQILDAIAPDAVGFLDLVACFPRPGRWLKEVAEQTVPPSPENLYCIHAVADDTDDNLPDGGVWLHTHGLLRCGLIELEILDAPASSVGEMGTLLNTTAGLFLDHGVPEPGEIFEVAAGVEVAWLPWRLGLGHSSRHAVGTFGDRDELHARPSGILLAPGRWRWLWPLARRWSSPARYAPRLADNPALYVSTFETERRCRQAIATLQRIVALFDRFGADDAWSFMVKLGFSVDDVVDGEREHLWFEVHGFDDASRPRVVDATLLNEPHHVAALACGERAEHSLERLSEWTVLSPHGRFGPDSLVHLEELVGVE